MAARAADERAAIAASVALASSARVPRLETLQPFTDALDDVDWWCNEAPSEMGEQSSLGAALERASQDRELAIVDPDYMHGRRPGVYSGKTVAGGAWEEFVPDAAYPDGGYVKRVWGQRPKQTYSVAPEEFGEKQIVATEMARNVGEVLGRLTAAQRELLLARHSPRALAGPMLRKVFGPLANVVHLSGVARVAWRARAVRVAGEGWIAGWLEGVAARHDTSTGRKGESALVKDIRKEMKLALEEAYQAFEDARAALPRARYPHQSRGRRAHRLSLVGGS